MRMTLRTTTVLLMGMLLACTEREQAKEPQNEGFGEVGAHRSGMSFSNDIVISDTFNYNTFPYIYMGGGVALGDINNDGLTDVFLTGNMVSNRLYLNTGGMTFEDITENAMVAGDSRWYTGATMVDINADGWLDIYVSVSGPGDTTENQLFVNNGDLTFTEMAKEYGIDDASNSIQSTFFDYDRDGDLDLFVCNYPIVPLTMPNYFYQDKMKARTHSESGHLFRNGGDGRFEDVTARSGLLQFGLSLGIATSDFNNDGWVDLYVSNDFSVPDYLFLNKGDGTFDEKVRESTRQTSMFGMGVDVADFNNDGLMDLFQVDMTPADHYRSKTNMASMDPESFYSGLEMGFHYQYMQNSLQVNNGNDLAGKPIFSNIARLTGMATTDWSWAPLFADFDNDGLKDVVITNGMRLDVNNNDLLSRETSTSLVPEKIDMNRAPSTPIENYLFRNKGGYDFEDVSKQWNANIRGFSNGISYGDLDNDGDLDMVVNNIDSPVSLLENNNQRANYLRIKLNGNGQNPMGIGAKVKVVTEERVQWIEQSPTRGFQSSVEPVLHFGLGGAETVDELKIVWPDGTVQQQKNIAANQTLELVYEKKSPSPAPFGHREKVFFREMTAAREIHFKHHEDPYDDFLVEPLLPHRNSQLGPGLAVADINADGRDDFYIGNGQNGKGALFIQQPNGEFVEVAGPWDGDRAHEDTGAVFVDIDSDGDQDLYVVSGGNNFGVKEGHFQDRLYINTATGFIKSEQVLPEMGSSGRKVAPFDYDGDGDMDLFVGGRIQPGNYLRPPQSYLLRNEGGRDLETRFKNVTGTVAPELANLGLVTDALWEDYNNDGKTDLILSGEWMPLSFFENDGQKLQNVTKKLHLEKTVGWWNTLEKCDLDNDGDMDIVAGNLGLNSKYQKYGRVAL